MPKKGEKITDPAILARLAKAREKALATRRKNSAARKDAKLLKAIEKQRERDSVQTKLKSATAKPQLTRQVAQSKPEEPVPEVKPMPVPTPVPEIKSEPEPEIVVRRALPPKKTKRRKRYVYVSESDESEEERAPPQPQRRQQQAPPRAPKSRREQMFDRIYTATYGGRRF
jgi:hypothetical protein